MKMETGGKAGGERREKRGEKCETFIKHGVFQAFQARGEVCSPPKCSHFRGSMRLLVRSVWAPCERRHGGARGGIGVSVFHVSDSPPVRSPLGQTQTEEMKMVHIYASYASMFTVTIMHLIGRPVYSIP